MSLTSYTDLVNQTATWMLRSGNATFTAMIPDFITLLEARLNYGNDDPEMPSAPLRVRQMLVVGNVWSLAASTNTAVLPTDFLQLRTLKMADTLPAKKLTYMTPNQMDAVWASNLTGPPQNYTIDGPNIRVAPQDSTSHTLMGDYWQKIPALTASNTSNWLLTAMPGIYLNGTCLEGSVFTRSANNISIFGRIYTSLVNALQKQNNAAMVGGDALQMQTDIGGP